MRGAVALGTPGRDAQLGHRGANMFGGGSVITVLDVSELDACAGASVLHNGHNDATWWPIRAQGWRRSLNLHCCVVFARFPPILALNSCIT